MAAADTKTAAITTAAAATATATATATAPATADVVPPAASYLLHVRIGEAKHVLAKDANGRSDPYVSLAVGGDHTTTPKRAPQHKAKTRVCPATLFPVWNEDFSFPLQALAGNLRLKVWDHDVGRTNDFLGQVVVRLDTLKRCGAITGWHPLVTKRNQLSQGALHVQAVVDTADRTAAWKNPKKPNDQELKALADLRNGLFAALEAADATRGGGTSVVKHKDLSVFCGTWNVGNASPADDQLGAWLRPPAADGGPGPLHDLYAIGVQECTYKPRKQEHARAHDDWDGVLAHHFAAFGGAASAAAPATATAAATTATATAPAPAAAPAAKDQKTGDPAAAAAAAAGGYVLVKTCSMLEIRLSVYARRELGPRISMVETHTEATGLAGVVGNKGGAVVTCHVDDLALCFVSAHLAAHQGKCARRNADFAEIVTNVRLGTARADLLHHCHHVLWMGDLNYRLEFGAQGDDHKPSAELFAQMTAKVQAKQYAELFASDQLVRERKAGRAFVGFAEGTYDFAPTFKVVKGKALEYNPERSPAYCDRILWRSFPGHAIAQTSFGAAPSVTTSDHKPVYGTFAVAPFVVANGHDSTRGPLTLTVTNLKARNLPVADVKTKSADPYVRFAAPFLGAGGGGSVKTGHLTKTLNPDWPDAAVPPMPSTLNAPARLRRAFVCVQVIDKDTVTKDDVMVDGVLFLADAVAAADAAPGKPFAFAVPLSRGGLAAGTLTGDLTLTWAPAPAAPMGAAALAALGFDAAVRAKYNF